MKFSAQEEYGLRCLLAIGRHHKVKAVTIPEISKSEGISQHNVAKLLRILRLNNFLDSERGQSGGYSLTRAPEDIFIKDVLYVLGGRLYDETFCSNHSGEHLICKNTSDCSLRSLWRLIQDAVDTVIRDLTLKDLISSENKVFSILRKNLSYVNTYSNKIIV